MRLFYLTALVMTAFAANSILNRLALTDGVTGPASFAAIRLVTGAVALLVFVFLQRRTLRPVLSVQWAGLASLVVYILGFSFAYVTLDAGIGALILFGGVQMTMFAGALLAGERPSARRWTGAVVAAAGLVYLLWPGGGAAPDPAGSALMAMAAVGWGVYSLAGRRATDPLAGTAANFALAAPVGVLVWVAVADGVSPSGAVYAALSGIVTSGLGYALWYSVLPQLQRSAAAIAQLTVPVIAMAGGIVLLGEAFTIRFAVSAILVLGGVLIGVLRPRGPATRLRQGGRDR